MAEKRLPRPVVVTACAINNPPKTSHIEADVKAENTTCGGAIANIIASIKKSTAVTCSGMVPSAHSPTVNTTSAAACIVVDVTPAGGGRKKMATAATTIMAVAISDQRRFNAALAS